MSEKNLDFKEISNRIKFSDVLNWRNIPFTQKGGELKGEIKGFKFIVNIEKNLFFSPDHDHIKGSVINFISVIDDIGLREAAKDLKSYFMDNPILEKKEIPNLELLYSEYLQINGITEELAKQYEIGLVKQRSIMNGRIAFKVYDDIGEVAGYIGWHPKKNDWLFPKNFKRPVYNLNNVLDCEEIIVTVSPFECLSNIAIGLTNCVSLLARSMTDSQEQLLKRFDRIILIHPEPDNIVLRLAKYCFIKSPMRGISSFSKDTDEENTNVN